MSPKRATKRDDDLRRQRDLGDEHDHAAAVRERVRRGPQVDLGLARPGDAVQQQPLARRGRDDRAQRRGLIGGQLGLRARGADGRRAGARGARRAGRCSTRPRASRRRSAARSPPAKRGSEASSARWRVAQALLACPRAPRRAARPQRGLGPRALRGQQERQRARRRRAVLGRHPQREVDELGGQPRLEDAPRRDGVVLGAVGQPGDHADDVAMAEGHDEDRADVDPLGPQVVERPAQRAGRRERLDVDYRWHRSPR